MSVQCTGYVLLTTLICIDAVRGMEGSFDSARISFSSVISGESEALYNDPLRAHICSSAAQTLSNDYSETEQIKVPLCLRCS